MPPPFISFDKRLRTSLLIPCGFHLQSVCLELGSAGRRVWSATTSKLMFIHAVSTMWYREMIRVKQCPKCGSERIAGPHNLHTDRSHLALDLPGLPTAKLEAYTCADCGYTELYSDSLGLENIRRAGRFMLPQEAPQSAPLYCPACFSNITPGQRRCPECGSPIPSKDREDV